MTGGVSGLERPEGDNSERFPAIGPLASGSESDEVDCERGDNVSLLICNKKILSFSLPFGEKSTKQEGKS